MKPASCQQGQRIGFLKGRIEVPDDFAEMGRDQIIEMFEEKTATRRPRADKTTK